MGHLFATNNPPQQYDGLDQTDDSIATAIERGSPFIVRRVAVHDEITDTLAILEKLSGQALLNTLQATIGLEVLEDEQDMHGYCSVINVH